MLNMCQKISCILLQKNIHVSYSIYFPYSASQSGFQMKGTTIRYIPQAVFCKALWCFDRLTFIFKKEEEPSDMFPKLYFVRHFNALIGWLLFSKKRKYHQIYSPSCILLGTLMLWQVVFWFVRHFNALTGCLLFWKAL